MGHEYERTGSGRRVNPRMKSADPLRRSRGLPHCPSASLDLKLDLPFELQPQQVARETL